MIYLLFCVIAVALLALTSKAKKMDKKLDEQSKLLKAYNENNATLRREAKIANGEAKAEIIEKIEALNKKI